MLAGVHLLVVSTLAVSAASDTTRPASSDSSSVSTRVVRTLEEFTVRSTALHDPLSTESVHLVSPATIRMLPVDRLAALVALQAGVVARGEDLYVRGGRAGETEALLDGIRLNEPQRGRTLAVPLLALREVELASGGLDADLGGALAGVLVLRTLDPPEHPEGALQWETDGRFGTHYDRVSGRAGATFGGIGAIATADAMLDDTHLPSPRFNERRKLLGGSFGWRADNRMSGHAKVVAGSRPQRVTLEILAGRRVYQPYDPAWSLDGWTTPCGDPDTCLRGPAYSPTPQPGYERYRAAEHAVMSDERRLLGVLAWERLGAREEWRATLGWSRSRSITSLNGHDDESYLIKDRQPLFGYSDSPLSEPLYVYGGDEPYFRKAGSDQYSAHAAWQRTTPRGSVIKAGTGVTYDAVELRELDVSTFGTNTDSVRAYRAFAPGGYAYGHLRWVFEGLAVNGGLRLEYFTAGPQAEAQSLGRPAQSFWTLSPRLGIAFPLSVRDVFSLSYVRIRQSPDRDFLYDNRRKVTNRQPIGNPALEPATLISYQGAVKHLLGSRWAVQAALFYRDLYGLVGARNTQPRLAIPRMEYFNVDNGHVIGYELGAIGVDRERARLELHYTWMDARGTTTREEGVPFGPRLRARPESIGEHPLDWDRRHSFSLIALWQPRHWAFAWTTTLGSPLPWTPRERRQVEPDVSHENSRRLGWEETSAVSVRWNPGPSRRHLTVGLDVLNLLGRRNEIAATLDGYPNPAINTVYDDYGAYRTATGQSGGAYWNDANNDGIPGWIPVHDPRLFAPPRAVRLFLGTEW